MDWMTGPSSSSAGVPLPSYETCQTDADSRKARIHTHLLALHWHTEEDDALKALLDERTDELLELVHTPSALAGEGRDLDARVGVVCDEDGVHEHTLGQGTLCLPAAGQRVLVASLENRPASSSALETDMWKDTHEMSRELMVVGWKGAMTNLVGDGGVRSDL